MKRLSYVLLIPALAGMLAGVLIIPVARWLTTNGHVETWRPLPSPPEPAARLMQPKQEWRPGVGCIVVIARTAGGTFYGCEVAEPLYSPAEGCWKRPTSQGNVSAVSTPFQPAHPPGQVVDSIQFPGRTWDASDVLQQRFVMLEDGSIWQSDLWLGAELDGVTWTYFAGLGCLAGLLAGAVLPVIGSVASSLASRVRRRVQEKQGGTP